MKYGDPSQSVLKFSEHTIFKIRLIDSIQQYGLVLGLVAENAILDLICVRIIILCCHLCTYAMYLNLQLFIGQCLWLFPIVPSYSHGWWHIDVTHRTSRATHIHLYHLQYITGGQHYFWILANNKQKLTRELNTYIIISCHWHLTVGYVYFRAKVPAAVTIRWCIAYCCVVGCMHHIYIELSFFLRPEVNSPLSSREYLAHHVLLTNEQTQNRTDRIKETAVGSPKWLQG